MSKIVQFTIRVYAIIFNQNAEILLSDEFALGMPITKFPGGGMEFGEGTIDCLHREAMEEFGQDLDVLDHFYTTDFFQAAITRPEFQLVSIYYFAKLKEKPKFKISSVPNVSPVQIEGDIAFRWFPVHMLCADTMTLPIDKIVAEKINKWFFENKSV